jgi:hypothetical protein
MSEHLRLYTWHPTAVKSLKMRGCETVSTEVRNENSQKMIDEIFKEIRILSKKACRKRRNKNCKKFHSCRDAKNVGWYVCSD